MRCLKSDSEAENFFFLLPSARAGPGRVIHAGKLECRPLVFLVPSAMAKPGLGRQQGDKIGVRRVSSNWCPSELNSLSWIENGGLGRKKRLCRQIVASFPEHAAPRTL